VSYVTGMIAAVPAENKEAFRAHAAAAAKLFIEFGATRVTDCWGDDVPKGETTDFFGAVKAEKDEVVVFSWIEFPSREVRDQVFEKMMSDPRMAEIGEMPFDGKRMIFGGFEVMVDTRA
jgi:uncharacterized protein YbaA (DUF1428 family)